MSLKRSITAIGLSAALLRWRFRGAAAAPAIAAFPAPGLGAAGGAVVGALTDDSLINLRKPWWK